MCDAEEVFLTILQLYMESSEMPLPSPEEVFICSTSTSEEEVFFHCMFV